MSPRRWHPGTGFPRRLSFFFLFFSFTAASVGLYSLPPYSIKMHIRGTRMLHGASLWAEERDKTRRNTTGVEEASNEARRAFFPNNSKGSISQASCLMPHASCPVTAGSQSIMTQWQQGVGRPSPKDSSRFESRQSANMGVGLLYESQYGVLMTGRTQLPT